MDHTQSDVNAVNGGDYVRLLVAIIAILLVAGLTRFYSITSQCLWFDEIWHVMLSSGNDSLAFRLPTDQLITEIPDYTEPAGAWWRIWGNMDGVLHPPLYHNVLRAWRAVFGDSVVALRGFSALLSVFAVIVIVDAARLITGSLQAGVWAAALLAVAPGQIHQAQEARNYTCMLLLGISAIAATLRSQRNPRSVFWPIAVGALSLSLMLTHYFAAGICAALTVYAAAFLSGRARWTLLGAVAVAGLVFIIAWGPTLRAQLVEVPETADPFLADPSTSLAKITMRASALPISLVAAAPANALTATGGAALLAWAIWTVRFNRRIALPLLCLGMTIMIPAALDLARSTHHLLYLRYTFVGSSCVVLILIAAAWNLHGRSRYVVLISSIVACSLAIPFFGRSVANLDFRPLAAHLRAHRTPGEPIVMLSANPLGRDGQALYCYLAYYGRLFPRPGAIATRNIHGELAAALSRHKRVWIASANREVDVGLVWPGAIVHSEARFDQVGSCFHIEPPR